MSANELPTEKEVEESVIRNLSKLEGKGQKVVLHITKGLSALIGKAKPGTPLKVLSDGLLAVADKALEDLSPATACKKGCGHCCKMAVPITVEEARDIGKAIGVEPRKVGMLKSPQHNINRFMAVPCTFLKKEVCTIYEHRPLACRTMVNISEYPQLCNVVDYPGNNVPGFDFNPIWQAEALVRCETKCINDIREFFPDGLNPPVSL